MTTHASMKLVKKLFKMGIKLPAYKGIFISKSHLVRLKKGGSQQILQQPLMSWIENKICNSNFLLFH